jgi:hypothetical protein
VDLVAAERPRVRATAEDPPFARYRDPQLVTTDDLDRARARTFPAAAGKDKPGRAAPSAGTRCPPRDGRVPRALHHPYGRPGCFGHEHTLAPRSGDHEPTRPTNLQASTVRYLRGVSRPRPIRDRRHSGATERRRAPFGRRRVSEACVERQFGRTSRTCKTFLPSTSRVCTNRLQTSRARS